MASIFEGAEEVRLSKREAFRLMAVLMDALELIDQTSPAFQVSWDRLRDSLELLRDRIWPDE